MKTNLFIILTICLLACSPKEELSGPAVIERSIAYHDPENQWQSFLGQLKINMEYADGSERLSTINYDKAKQIFSVSQVKGEDTVFRYIDQDTIYSLLNGAVVENEDTIKQWRLTPEGTRLYRDYYSYLYGLPMKLKDSGTLIGEKAEKVTFQDEEYLKVRVTYSEEVGSDIWYFYFDPEDYSMDLYQFYHEAEKNDGEYILLEGELSFKSMRTTRAT